MIDQDSFTAIYEAEYGVVFNYCRKRVDTWHIAEDLASNVFEIALRRLPHPDPRALVLTIARYEVLQYFDRERRRRTWSFADVVELTYENYQTAALASDGGIDGIVEACDTAMAAALLRSALLACSEADLRMIHLRYIQNLPATEVAERLGMNPNLYNKHQTRMLESLAKRLARRFDPALVAQVRIRGERPTVCQECGEAVYLRDLCRSHYNKLRRREKKQARVATARMLL
jgi:RNA polymerase sigma factor (sigma-70 family)